MPKIKMNGYALLLHEIRDQNPTWSLGQAQDITNARWSIMSEEEKLEYKEKAKACPKYDKKNKQKMTGAENISMDTVYKSIDKQAKTKSIMENTIINIVTEAKQTESLAVEVFYFMHANIFCKHLDNDNLIPAEIAVSKFSFQEGIIDTFHAIINPQEFPTGTFFDAKKESDMYFRIPFPPNCPEGALYPDMAFKKLLDFLRIGNEEAPPIVYTNSSEIEKIQQLFKQFPKFRQVKVYDVSALFYTIYNIMIEDEMKKMPTIQYVTEFLVKADVTFEYEMIGCEFHNITSDALKYCSKSIVTRLGYIFFAHLLKYFDIPLESGKHCPADKEIPCIFPQSNRPMSSMSSRSSCYSQISRSHRPSSNYDYEDSEVESIDSSALHTNIKNLRLQH